MLTVVMSNVPIWDQTTLTFVKNAIDVDVIVLWSFAVVRS
jgi:hypothetical protein